MAKKNKPKEEIVRTTLRMPKPLWEKVQHRCIDENRGIAELINQAVLEYVRKGESR
jgi:hypothetical protein